MKINPNSFPILGFVVSGITYAISTVYFFRKDSAEGDLEIVGYVGLHGYPKQWELLMCYSMVVMMACGMHLFRQFLSWRVAKSEVTKKPASE